MSAPATAKLPFTRLGRYEVRALLAEGGMAGVYLGRSAEEGREVVALKVIRREYSRDLQFVAMFLDEAKLASRLNHPNIVKIYEQANEGGHLFIAMELLFGQSLASVWEKTQHAKRKLPFEIAAWIGARVADALHHAHELRDDTGVAQEVVHRDINPSNIFVTYGGQVKIIDFGLAKAVDRLTTTVAGVVKGKLAYMSPEQVSGAGVDRRADIFSLGTTLWELTCDRRLFKCEREVDTMQRVMAADVPRPSSIVPGYPAELERIVLRALTKDRDARYPTAAELCRDLDAFVGAGGRIVTPGTLLDLMTTLFPAERDRDAKWYEETGTLPMQTVPLAPIQLAAEDLETVYGETSAIEPRPSAADGTAPTMLAAATPQPPPGRAAETSLAGTIAGVPSGPLSLLTAGELAAFGALGMLVIVAVIVAIVSLSK